MASTHDCSICIQPCFENQTAVGDVIQTHCNHMFHSNCMDKWNYSGRFFRNSLSGWIAIDNLRQVGGIKYLIQMSTYHLASGDSEMT